MSRFCTPFCLLSHAARCSLLHPGACSRTHLGTEIGGWVVPRVKLTDRFVAGVKADGRTDYFDAVTTGLVLRVAAGGRRKNWCLFYTSPLDGKRARVGLGAYPALSLAGARTKAIEAAGAAADGSNPRRTMKASACMTVAGLVEAYIRDPGKARLRTIDEIERRLRRDVLPVIGDLRITEVARRDVRNVFEPIERSGKPVSARHAFADIRAMLRWAVEHEYLPTNPLERMRGPEIGAPRERVLTDSEIKAVWHTLPKIMPVNYQRIVQLCLITAQRLGEVSGLSRQELHLDRAEWHLPGSRTKNKAPHIVPLSGMAVSVVTDALDEAAGAGALFPNCGVTVSAMISLANKSGRFDIPHWTIHDLRRTALTGMARLGVAPIVLGHVANHRTTTRAGVTLAVYQQYSYGAEKRHALDLWADRLAAIVGGSGADVVPMRGRHA
jgi:integrase